MARVSDLSRHRLATLRPAVRSNPPELSGPIGDQARSELGGLPRPAPTALGDGDPPLDLGTRPAADPPARPPEPAVPGGADPLARPPEPTVSGDADPPDFSTWLAADRPARPISAAVRRVRDALSGRLIKRWVPDGAGRVRLDPGRRAALVLAVVVLAAAVVTGALVWRSRPVPEPMPALAVVDSGTASGTPVADASATELVVSIAGQVLHPGLVHLTPGARVADAVQAAGGPMPGCDLTGVNLARRLTDGEHVVVGPAPVGAAEPGPAGRTSGAGARVDLNTATLVELDALPGVGPVTAQRILDWRTEHGRFASVDQLREVDGIGEARFAQLKALVLA